MTAPDPLAAPLVSQVSGPGSAAISPGPAPGFFADFEPPRPSSPLELLADPPSPASFESTVFDASSFSTSFDPLPTFDDPPGAPAGAFDALQSLTAGPGPGGAGRSADLPPPPPPPPSFGAPLGSPARPAGAPGERRLSGLDADSRFAGLSVPPTVARAVIGGVAVVCMLGGLTFTLAKLGGEPRPLPSATTLDPKAPPPIGQLQLGGKTTTTVAPELAAGWATYRSPDGTFAVNFPGQAQSRGYQKQIGRFTQNGLEAFLQAGTDGPIYSAAYVELPTASTFADSQDTFDQSFAGSYDNAGPFTVGPGLEATSFVRKPGKGPATRGFVLLKGKRAYVLESLDASDEDYHRFITGFRWLADPTT